MSFFLLTDEELERWQEARALLLRLIEKTIACMREERSKDHPDQTRLNVLIRQMSALEDIRYTLTPYDEDRVLEILGGRVPVKSEVIWVPASMRTGGGAQAAPACSLNR